MRVSFDEENRREDPFRFPKLTLDTNEVARILVYEDPDADYVHTINHPVLGPDGRGVRITVKNRRGEDYEKWKDEWKGRYLCVGDPQLVEDKGFDPDSCPACQAAKDHFWMRNPERRFAMHVVRYELDQHGNPSTPLMFRIVGWGFTEGRFDTLVEFKKSWKDLRIHDLTLGPCTDKGFQKFDMRVEPDAIWQRNEDSKQRVSQATRSTRFENIRSLNGREVSVDKLAEEVAVAAELWRKAEGGDSSFAASPLEQQMVAASTDVDSLLPPETVAPTTAPEPAPAAVSAQPVQEPGDLLAGLDDAPAAPVEEAAQGEKFDDLVNLLAPEDQSS
jgi:hypothetical protein